jgi:hypothetical protein
VIGGLGRAYVKQDRVTLGSVIHIPFYTDAESTSPTYNGKPYLEARVTLVGVVVFDSSVVQDDIDALGSAVVLLSPALTHQLSTCCRLLLRGRCASCGRRPQWSPRGG